MMCQTWVFRPVTALVAAVLLAATSARADLNLVQNGDFSEPDGAHWTQLVAGYLVDFTSPPGVAVLRESDDYNYDRNGNPLADGGFSLTGTKQEFTLAQAATVALGFTFGLTVTAPSETDFFDVLLDDHIVFSKSTSGLVPAPGGSVSFTASPHESQALDAGPHWLVLRLVGENDFLIDINGQPTDPLLTTVSVDDVTCAVVPLPGAALLGMIGLSYSGWRLRRLRTL